MVGLTTPYTTLRNQIIIHSFDVCNLINSLVVYAINGSVYIFVALNLDRLHAIMAPITYRRWRTKRWVPKIAIAVSQLVALFCASPFLFHFGSPLDSCFCTFPGFSDPFHRWWMITFFFLAPTSLIAAIWLAITTKLVWEGRYHTQDATQRSASSQRR